MSKPTPTPSPDSTPEQRPAPTSETRRARRAELADQAPTAAPSVFRPHPNDSAVVRFFKKLGRVGQVVFGALLALFIAVVTFAAG